MVVLFQQFPDTFLQRFDIRSQQVGLEMVKEMMEGEEGVDFRAVEPQAGQLVPWMLGIRIVEPVTVLLPVSWDRRV